MRNVFMTERFRRWYEYEQDAHAKVLRSLETVPEGRRSSAEFHKAVDLLGHIDAARRMWLFRFGVSSRPPDSLFPQGVSLPEVTANFRDTQEGWSAYLNNLDDAALARSFEYQSLDSGRFRNRVEDILAQLFGHSWYHRGQIATLVRAAGGEPAITDFVFWCREPVAPPEDKKNGVG
jgi:uncharacterized damage-inducible protein DinB